MARTFEDLGYDRAAAYRNSESQALRMKKYYDITKKTEGSCYEINDMKKLKNYGKTNGRDHRRLWNGTINLLYYGFKRKEIRLYSCSR